MDYGHELNLEKVDILRERAGLSYRDAVEYLERANGDVVKALVFIEEDKHRQKEVISETGQEVLEKVKHVVRRGNEMKIKIHREGQSLIEVPVTVGLIGTDRSVPGPCRGCCCSCFRLFHFG